MARGRRVNSNGEKSKALLLEKAIEQFSIYGYHQTKISDIVKAADLTQPTFYLYFQSKESLFNDLNYEFKNQLFKIWQQVMDTSNEVKNSKNIILLGLKNIFTYFSKNPKLTKIGFYESSQAVEVKSELAKQFVEILNRSEDKFYATNHVDNKILAESLLGSIERLTLTCLLGNNSDPEKLANDIVNIYFVDKKELEQLLTP